MFTVASQCTHINLSKDMPGILGSQGKNSTQIDSIEFYRCSVELVEYNLSIYRCQGFFTHLL